MRNGLIWVSATKPQTRHISNKENRKRCGKRRITPKTIGVCKLIPNFASGSFRLCQPYQENVNHVRKVSTLPVWCLTTLSGKSTKTVNLIQEKTLLKTGVAFVAFVEKGEKSTLFHARKNCLFRHEIQNPRKTPLICPRIASNVFDVHLYHWGKNLRSTVP